MSRAPRLNGDPVGSEKPRGKNGEQRKGRYDGGWTGTEIRLRDQCLRQFMTNPEGSPPSDAYVSAPCWCDCGRLKSIGDKCSRCAGNP